MANTKLFGNSISPACKYCINGYKNPTNESILCSRHGVVAPDYKCRHFYYDPILRLPKLPLAMEKMSKEDFSID